MQIYYIGGSPCSGKSTVAEMLAQQYDLHYFKSDDYLEEFTARGTSAGLPVCRRIQRMTADETWLRPPHIQCREELDYYAEIFPFVQEKLQRMHHGRIIAEGAAFLPSLMHAQGIPAAQYIAITPSREFQITRYRQRPWVPHILQDCTDKGLAFANWMERDALFAEDVRQQCVQLGYPHWLTDGAVSPEERLAQIAAHFQISRLCQKHS